MVNKLFVGNLSWGTTSESLKAFFEQVGPVAKSDVIKDRDTGRSRGFGFIEMENPEDNEKAIVALNGQNLDGREITVNEARERQARS